MRPQKKPLEVNRAVFKANKFIQINEFPWRQWYCPELHCP